MYRQLPLKSRVSIFPALAACAKRHPPPWATCSNQQSCHWECMQYALCQKMGACGVHTMNTTQYLLLKPFRCILREKEQTSILPQHLVGSPALKTEWLWPLFQASLLNLPCPDPLLFEK